MFLVLTFILCQECTYVSTHAQSMTSIQLSHSWKKQVCLKQLCRLLQKVLKQLATSVSTQPIGMIRYSYVATKHTKQLQSNYIYSTHVKLKIIFTLNQYDTNVIANWCMYQLQCSYICAAWWLICRMKPLYMYMYSYTQLVSITYMIKLH